MTASPCQAYTDCESDPPPEERLCHGAMLIGNSGRIRSELPLYQEQVDAILKDRPDVVNLFYTRFLLDESGEELKGWEKNIASWLKSHGFESTRRELVDSKLYWGPERLAGHIDPAFPLIDALQMGNEVEGKKVELQRYHWTFAFKLPNTSICEYCDYHYHDDEKHYRICPMYPKTCRRCKTRPRGQIDFRRHMKYRHSIDVHANVWIWKEVEVMYELYLLGYSLDVIGSRLPGRPDSSWNAAIKNNIYGCLACSRAFRTPDSFQVHSKLVHRLKDRLFVCCKCNKIQQQPLSRIHYCLGKDRELVLDNYEETSVFYEMCFMFLLRLDEPRTWLKSHHPELVDKEPFEIYTALGTLLRDARWREAFEQMSMTGHRLGEAMLDQLLCVAASEADTRASRVITVSSANPEWYKLLKTRSCVRDEPPCLTAFELGLSSEVEEWFDLILNQN